MSSREMRTTVLTDRIELVQAAWNPNQYFFCIRMTTHAICKCCGKKEGSLGAYCVTCGFWVCMECKSDGILAAECAECMVGD